jgi:hypothetical protein
MSRQLCPGITTWSLQGPPGHTIVLGNDIYKGEAKAYQENLSKFKPLSKQLSALIMV